MNRIHLAPLFALALVVAACGGTGENGSTGGTPDFVDAETLRTALANDNPDLYASLKIVPNTGAQASLVERTIEILPRCYALFEGATETPTTGLAVGAPIGGQTCDAYPTGKTEPDGARIVGAENGADTLWITRETTNVSPIPGENVAATEFLIPEKAPDGSVWARIVTIRAGGETTALPETLAALVAADLGDFEPVEDGKIALDLSEFVDGDAAIIIVQLVWRTEDGLLRGMAAYPFSYVVETPVTLD